MRIWSALVAAALFCAPGVALAGYAPSADTSAQAAQAEKSLRLAGSYQGKKYCYRVGSAQVCN